MDQESQPSLHARLARARRVPSRDLLRGAAVALAGALFFAGPAKARAQDAGEGQQQDTTVYAIDPVIVTATRGPRAISETPRPAIVIQPRDIAEVMPNSVSDLLRLQPGLDVTGVGISQVRPQIRGQSGQRILLLDDGLRMNNTRRESNFGELPALVDIGAVDHVEIVRGPASVLYGSDAIGGVINILTKVPTRDGFGGTASYLFGSAGEQNRVSARMEGRSGAFSLMTGGSWRTAGAYDAPKGSFGDITLANGVTVNHTGVDDANFDARLGWDFTPNIGVFGKVEHYRSDDSGFGIVDPDLYAPGYPNIDITYPRQRFTKLTTGVTAVNVGTPVADRVEVQAYGQDNERKQVFDFFQPFGPGAGVSLVNRGFTDIRTYGFRAEARKLLPGGVELTYGADGFEDKSEGTNQSVTMFVGGGPPPDTSNAPTIPNANLRSVGGFVQGEMGIGERLSLVAGGRFQHVSAESFASTELGNTPASKSNSAWVGALNAMFEVFDGFHLVASTGRGFRFPNLVELFLEGVVPEGPAWQQASQGLDPETSFNVDLGARYQTPELFVETFVFKNKIYDGIRTRLVTDDVGNPVQTFGLDTYEYVNVDEIVLKGIESNVDYRHASGVGVGAGLSILNAKDAIDPGNPIGESYSHKLTGRVGYHDPAGRFWTQFEARYSGKQKDAALTASDPVGTELPAFTVLGLRGGFQLPEFGGLRQSVTVAVNNLTNELYAETANASFFRPEPKRNVTVSLNVAF